jgi:hypothetical protein
MNRATRLAMTLPRWLVGLLVGGCAVLIVDGATWVLTDHWFGLVAIAVGLAFGAPALRELVRGGDSARQRHLTADFRAAAGRMTPYVPYINRDARVLLVHTRRRPKALLGLIRYSAVYRVTDDDIEALDRTRDEGAPTPVVLDCFEHRYPVAAVFRTPEGFSAQMDDSSADGVRLAEDPKTSYFAKVAARHQAINAGLLVASDAEVRELLDQLAGAERQDFTDPDD